MINGTTVRTPTTPELRSILLCPSRTRTNAAGSYRARSAHLGPGPYDAESDPEYRLPDGSRVAVVGAPSSINGPTLTIRKFNRWYTSDELIESGSMPSSVRDKVVEMIGDKNGIISGGTGSGKRPSLNRFAKEPSGTATPSRDLRRHRGRQHSCATRGSAHLLCRASSIRLRPPSLPADIPICWTNRASQARSRCRLSSTRSGRKTGA